MQCHKFSPLFRHVPMRASISLLSSRTNSNTHILSLRSFRRSVSCSCFGRTSTKHIIHQNMQVSKRKVNSKAGVNSLKEKHVEEMLTEMKKKKSSEEDDVASAGKEVIQDHNDHADDVDGVDDEEEPEENERRVGKTHVSYGFHMVRGKMNHGMEDYVVAEWRTVDGNELGLYAIFDGHSGRDVAEYLQANLFDNILKQDDLWRNPDMAMKRAYKSTDEEILEKVGPRGGSTAVTALLVNGKTLVVGNVGDSRGILCRRRRAIEQITVDHEPKSSEKEAVESRGGFVSRKPGSVPRVDGMLAMTRAFGDRKVKEHITSEPDVRVENMDADSKFIVLASDGIWKVMSNEDVSECIEDVGDAQEAAEELVKMALSRGSPDDISCVVVMFK